MLNVELIDRKYNSSLLPNGEWRTEMRAIFAFFILLFGATASFAESKGGLSKSGFRSMLMLFAMIRSSARQQREGRRPS